MAETLHSPSTATEDARRHSLADWSPPETGATRLRVPGWRALVNLRGRPGEPAFLDAAREALGFDLPLTPNRWSSGQSSGQSNGQGRSACWLGPDEWLVLAADGEAPELERRLRRAAKGLHISVVDVSHQYCGFELAGPAAREVLAKDCPLDLHPRSFPRDGCAQTLLAGTGILLKAGNEPDAFELWVRNSFAGHAARWLDDALAEFADT